MFFSSSPSPSEPQLPAAGPGVIEKCICELCECGDHRCPFAGTLGVASASPDEQFGRQPGGFGQSEYGRSFVAKGVEHAESFRPPSTRWHRRNLPAMELESTHQHDFRPFLYDPPIVQGPPGEDMENLLRPSEPFTARTTHQVDFDTKPIPAESLAPPKLQSTSSDVFRPPQVPFLGESVHRSDFGPKPLEPAKPFRPREERDGQGEGQPRQPMEAETTHSHDFKRFGELEPAKPFRPPSGSRHFVEERAKFEDSTEHRSNFGRKSVEPAASFRPKTAEWRPSDEPMASRSEYQEGFRPMAHLPKSEPSRPSENLHTPSNVPFTAKSTHQDDFAPKPMPAERLCLAERVLTRREHSYKFAGLRNGHRFYRRFEAYQPSSPSQGMRLAPVQG